MSHIGSYEERIKDFSWSIAERELGYAPGDVINIGWYATDRICRHGQGRETGPHPRGLHRRRRGLHL